MNYLTDDYHKELAERYEKRKLKLSTDELVKVAQVLGFTFDPKEIEKATGGNVSGTYLTSEYVIKIQNDPERKEFLSNKIISDHFSKNDPVVKVLSYDYFDKTEYEILIMERGKGRLLLDDFLSLPQEIQKNLFSQILDLVNKTSKLTFKDFGEVRLVQSFPTFKEYINFEFDKYTDIIKEQELCAPADVEKIKSYFSKHLKVFDDENSSFFNHTDVHIGNVLHEGNTVSLLFDFDGAIKGPKYLSLPKIIGAIEEPSQFVEGTKYFDKYKDKKFEFLFPVLGEKMQEVLATPNLIRKLNLVGITEGMKWISENWSAEWNKNQIVNLLTNELAENEKALNSSYYGKILSSLVKIDTR